MTAADLAALAALIDQAEAEGKWLHCQYQDLWFSPADLRASNASGSFRWGVVNWTLRDPRERLEQLRREAEIAASTAAQFAQRITP